MANQESRRIRDICAALKGLTEMQLAFIEQVVEEFSRPYTQIERLETSDLINDCLLRNLGDALRVHHTISREPFTKDKFEYALERIANLCGLTATLASRGNPGHDITIDTWRISLKTQANQAIRADRLHISKFMELGKGKWSDNVEDLIGLRNQFLDHMRSYDRILTLRSLSRHFKDHWYYELVEIPKSLLEEAQHGVCRIVSSSTQSPKPGYCDVESIEGQMKFQLYFDGGTERKLQIRNLAKSYCLVHAFWIFDKPTENLDSEALLDI